MLANSDSIRLEEWEFDKTVLRTSSKNKAKLLLALVERVKKLENVVVKSTSFINEDDELVVIPGPWAIVKPIFSPGATLSPRCDFDDDDDDDDEEKEAVTPSSPAAFLDHRSRSVSTTAGARSRNASTASAKYVVRNEFGHARIQQYLAHPERERTSSKDSKDSKDSRDSNERTPEELFETGGHVVLHPSVFETCIAKGWGMRHPLAGHYHPITGSQIPETTLLFRAPASQADLEVVWNIVVSSYLWVTQCTEN